jgi:glycosyltransferase involved in cell wall biosynthesis
MKIAILWTGLSGYMNACLKELASREGIELFVCYQGSSKDAPFEGSQFQWITNRHVWYKEPDRDALGGLLRAFAPDIMVVAGWHVSVYRRMAMKHSNKCWRVVTMDSWWTGTPKQILGTWLAPVYVRPIADAIWLPGDRQAVFARKLGFEQKRILRGLYSCDRPAFEREHFARLFENRPVARSFLYVGRFAREKGLETLVKAYEKYRDAAEDPWPLICCGAGPLRFLLEAKIGIRVDDFVQPESMPGKLAGAGCLVLPSLFERWGLVVHEAASAGALILASDHVGAVPHLVQPGYNGFIFGKNDTEGLASLMSRVSGLSDASLDRMSKASHMLSEQFSPNLWADMLLRSYVALSNARVSEGRSTARMH